MGKKKWGVSIEEARSFVLNDAARLDVSQGRTPLDMLPCEAQNVQPSVLAGTQKEDGSNNQLAAGLC